MDRVPAPIGGPRAIEVQETPRAIEVQETPRAIEVQETPIVIEVEESPIAIEDSPIVIEDTPVQARRIDFTPIVRSTGGTRLFYPSKECVVCMEAMATVRCRPCNHVCFCQECWVDWFARMMAQYGGVTCAICREIVM